MSGGVAYIYDKANSFKKNCNMEMVMFDIIDATDEAFIKNIIFEHLNLTASDVATVLLKDWDLAIKKFVKVMPVEYKAVLEKRKVMGAVAEVVNRKF